MCTKSGAGLALEAIRLVPQSVGLAGLAPYLDMCAMRYDAVLQGVERELVLYKMSST